MKGSEVPDKYVKAMGPELGHVHSELFQQLSWLHLNWRQYRDLFAEDANLAVLVKAASLFAQIIDRALHQATVLHICRLTDQRRGFGYERLSLTQYPPMIGAQGDEDFAAEIESLVRKATRRARPLREWRNQRFAHRGMPDPRTPPTPLPPADREVIETAIEAITDVVNRVEDHYCRSIVAYDMTIHPYTGTGALVRRLRRGLVSEED